MALSVEKYAEYSESPSLHVHACTCMCTFHKVSFLYIDIKGMEHVPNIFMSFDKYLFLEMINILN